LEQAEPSRAHLQDAQAAAAQCFSGLAVEAIAMPVRHLAADAAARDDLRRPFRAVVAVDGDPPAHDVGELLLDAQTYDPMHVLEIARVRVVGFAPVRAGLLGALVGKNELPFLWGNGAPPDLKIAMCLPPASSA
jgi:hypothetical protein